MPHDNRPDLPEEPKQHLRHPSIVEVPLSAVEERRAWIFYSLAPEISALTDDVREATEVPSNEVEADAYFDGLERRVADALASGCEEPRRDTPLATVAAVWVGRMRSHVQFCAEVTEYELHREGQEGFGREAGRAALEAVFGGPYRILTLPDAMRALEALGTERRAFRAVYEWVLSHGKVTAREVARALHRYRGRGGTPRAAADLLRLVDAGVLARVDRQGRRGPATIAFQVATTGGGRREQGRADIQQMAEPSAEENTLGQWLATRKQIGQVRRRKGACYAEALADSIARLRVVGLMHVKDEAVALAWYGGFCRLSGAVAVLTPADPGSTQRRAVDERLNTHRLEFRARSAGEEVVLEFLDLALAGVMMGQPP